MKKPLKTHSYYMQEEIIARIKEASKLTRLSQSMIIEVCVHRAIESVEKDFSRRLEQ